MIRLFLAFFLILPIAACGVQGGLYLPKDQVAGAPPPKPAKKAPRPSVQKSEAEQELMDDAFLKLNPEGEYDMRNIGEPQ